MWACTYGVRMWWSMGNQVVRWWSITMLLLCRVALLCNIVRSGPRLHSLAPLGLKAKTDMCTFNISTTPRLPMIRLSVIPINLSCGANHIVNNVTFPKWTHLSSIVLRVHVTQLFNRTVIALVLHKREIYLWGKQLVRLFVVLLDLHLVFKV